MLCNLKTAKYVEVDYCLYPEYLQTYSYIRKTSQFRNQYNINYGVNSNNSHTRVGNSR